MKIIGITLGDPGGIGPEVVLKSLHLFKKTNHIPIIYGPKEILTKLETPYTFEPWIGRKSAKPNTFYWSDISLETTNWVIGKPDARNGHISYQTVEQAVLHANLGEIDGIVTAPISKTSWNLAGYRHKGHTGMIAALTGEDMASMAFYTPKLKTVLTTVHIPFINIANELTTQALNKATDHALLFAKILKIESPKIALAGLNPHAGESGLIGSEEQTLLIPYVEAKQKENIPITGPYPPDTLYRRAYEGEFDIVISLYHDQALIPIKLIGFEDAVNVTLGLPFLRTSPDHGTAFDIAYQNKASARSMQSAISFLQNAL
jgi:4-hydroxythreonine-4-phosphate dehydrogenase